MAKWKMCRQCFGNDEFSFKEGEEVTVGRGLSNSISLSSLVISRNHCVLKVEKNQIIVTDLSSSNGTYIGKRKIPTNIPVIAKDLDLIGFGWTIGGPAVTINDSEKYVFQLVRECRKSIVDRIEFQSENESDEIEDKIASLDSTNNVVRSPVLNTHAKLKRKKIDSEYVKPKIKTQNHNTFDEVIKILTDSEPEINKHEVVVKKPKVENPSIKDEGVVKTEPVKSEIINLDYEPFEYKDYEEEAIQIDSDSDSESEQWLLRLSQSSPGKPFMKVSRPSTIKQEDCSYSQIDDELVIVKDNKDSDEEYVDDLITILPQSINTVQSIEITDDEDCNDLIKINSKEVPIECHKIPIVEADEVDSITPVIEPKQALQTAHVEGNYDTNKKAKIINALAQQPRKKSCIEGKLKVPSSKQNKSKKSSSKKQISKSQKEERKQKLKEIAIKVKDHHTDEQQSSISNKGTVNVKISTSNRGAFLSELAQAVVKPTKRKSSPKKSLNDKNLAVPDTVTQSKDVQNLYENIENKEKPNKKAVPASDKSLRAKNKKATRKEISENLNVLETREPLKSLRPLTGSEESISGKPFSKVGPMPTKKSKKKVSFSSAPPQVRVFEIAPGNKMRRTSLVKTTLVDVQHMPVFSLEKVTLMKILRWNPHWLDEQVNNSEPPPILGHSNLPMALFHSFSNHSQYVQQVGDLLLMEIWESLTQGYMRVRNQENQLQMQIESLPPVPTQDRFCELFNFSANLSVPKSDPKNVPRLGEVLLVNFGPESARNVRFLFVHNVRSLPSPPNNVNTFYSISFQATFTEKMRSLRPGEIMLGRSLAYINKELTLFEAMEYMAGSPLSEAILRPEPRHFVKTQSGNVPSIKNPWTVTLNEEQQEAVNNSVNAALGDKPCIQMVQGPPGTGKSSVICSIVMSYFYGASEKKQQNRGKILICATSNAAVDELVLRLLNIRQSLPHADRFRMVRVGRAEAMHPRARDVSSQQLAARDAQRVVEPTHPHLQEEISHLEAKMNMWKTAAQDAKDPVRVAYCQGRLSQILNRIALLRGGGVGGKEELQGAALARAERRIVEGADIVVTTLASAISHKLRGLKRRIALCIVDEAGQAIEPETLIPLTLDVSHLTLIGDPQQLPGYICSQRAKEHGLGESLFSRLSSSAETWERSPVLMLRAQYRMQADIADYPSRAFYAGRMRSARAALALPVPPYAVVAVPAGNRVQGAGSGSVSEAWGAARLARALQSALRPLHVALLTPYHAQKDLLRGCLRALLDPSESMIEVNTVDSFQGQERDVVVVSLARSQGVGFLTDVGRMNVMLTRAKHGLYVCLNPNAILKHNQWRTLVEDAQRRNFYKVLPKKACNPPSADSISNDEILRCLNT